MKLWHDTHAREKARRRRQITKGMIACNEKIIVRPVVLSPKVKEYQNNWRYHSS